MRLPQPLIFDFQISEKYPQGLPNPKQIRDPISDIPTPKMFLPVKHGGNVGRIGLAKAQKTNNIMLFQAPVFQKLQDKLDRSRQPFRLCHAGLELRDRKMTAAWLRHSRQSSNVRQEVVPRVGVAANPDRLALDAKMLPVPVRVIEIRQRSSWSWFTWYGQRNVPWSRWGLHYRTPLSVEYRNEENMSMNPVGSVASLLISFTTLTTTTALADGDREKVSARQSSQFDDESFSRKTSSSISAICHNAVGTLGDPCSLATVIWAIMTSSTARPFYGLPIICDSAPATPAASGPTDRHITPLSNIHYGSVATMAAITTGSTVQVQALYAKGAAPATAPSCGTGNDGQTTGSLPRPLEGPGFGNPPRPCFLHPVLSRNLPGDQQQVVVQTSLHFRSGSGQEMQV